MGEIIPSTDGNTYTPYNASTRNDPYRNERFPYASSFTNTNSENSPHVPNLLFSSLSDAENAILQFGGENAVNLKRLAKLVEDDDGRSDEATAADMAEALKRDKDGTARLTPEQKRAIEWMQKNLDSIDDMESLDGDFWTYVDGVSSTKLEKFTETKDVTHASAVAAYEELPEEARSDDGTYRYASLSDVPGYDGDWNADRRRIQIGDREFTASSNGNLSYKVEKGDSISKIAATLLQETLGRPATQAELKDYVRDIVILNGLDQNGRRADLIYPDEVLIFPPHLGK